MAAGERDIYREIFYYLYFNTAVYGLLHNRR